MRLRGVGRRYGLGGPWVLRGVDLELPRPALLRVEGTNGSGKSTLLRLFAGIDAPSAGRITGRPRRAAYVPERFPAALPFSTAGYLTHLARVRGMRRAAAVRTAEMWLERFGAGEHARTPLAELSKGASQKVAVSQALLAEPELLVLDEAWTGLDPSARGELDRAVAERVTGGGTVVFVDHDPRRLAGAATGTFRVTGGRVRPAREAEAADGPAATAPPRGPSARITVTGPPGAAPPDGLPGTPRHSVDPDGTVHLTVPAVYSDALLRGLLDARPAWHVHAVTPPVDPPADPPVAPPHDGSTRP